jgi:HSP20 family molecular chaperone IbpA
MFRNIMLYPSDSHALLGSMEKIMKSSYQKDNFYPPYNTYSKGEKTYIEVAVTGFRKDELKCYYDDDGLFVIEGSKDKEEVEGGDEKEYFVRNLSTKNFKRKFNTPKNTQLNGVRVENGLLVAEFERIKPDIKYIEIK